MTHDINLDEDLGEHDLALGNTRPAIVPLVNMPLVDVVVFAFAGLQAYMLRPQFVLLVAVAFSAAVSLYRKDYNAGRCFICWSLTSMRHLAGRTFGGSFISPDAVSQAGTYRGFLHG